MMDMEGIEKKYKYIIILWYCCLLFDVLKLHVERR